jgi:hypothetical protein
MEANEILRGIDVPVTPQNAGNGFVEYFQHIHDTDELMGQFDIHQIGLLKIQAMKHEQMLAAIQKQQAQVANMQQQQINSQMAAPVAGGPQQAPMAPQGPMSIAAAGG